MKRLPTIATALAVLTVPALAGPAHAGSAANTTVKIVFVGGPVGVVRSVGAINAVGAVTEENTLLPDGTFHGTLRFQFLLGTVTAPFSGVVTSVDVDPTTCAGRFTTVGDFTVSAGTGAYAGISGRGDFTERGVFNAVPTPSGCSPTLQVRTWLETDATATISLPRRGGLLG